MGVLATHSLKFLLGHMDALIERGLLEAHLEDEYRRLFITPAGIAALRDTTVILPNPRIRSRPAGTHRTDGTKGTKGTEGTRENRLLTEDECDRFEQLRSWRRTESRRTNTAPFTLFHDSELRAIARENPATIADLGAIPGIGPRKVELHGKAVLCLLHGDGEFD